MLNWTMRAALETRDMLIEVARCVRNLRTESWLKLIEVSNTTGISPSTLSQAHAMTTTAQVSGA